MSTENLEQFMDNVADSPQLQANIGEKIDAALIALGAECGCEFTAEELEEYVDRHEAYIDLNYFEGCRLRFDSFRTAIISLRLGKSECAAWWRERSHTELKARRKTDIVIKTYNKNANVYKYSLLRGKRRCGGG